MHREKIIAIGHVQGVGFRFSAQTLAVSLGLTGFVKNMSDGSVYIEVQGDRQVIGQFCQAIVDIPPDSQAVLSRQDIDVLVSDTDFVIQR